MARPTKFTDDVIRKIEEVAALDGTVEEMAYYADLNADTIYSWLKEKPEFSERINKLRQRPVLKARQTVNKRMEESYVNAMDYLKRKKKLEFGDSTDITSDGKPMQVIVPSAVASRFNINGTDNETERSDTE